MTSVESLASSGRWIPESLSLKSAIDNSRQNQTVNSPALATLFLLDHQLQWMLAQGGLDWTAERCRQSSRLIYQWAEGRPWARPYVAIPEQRSSVVATIDLDDSTSAKDVSAILRRNGVVDTEAYRKLGRNQLRLGLFPAVEPADVEQLTRCVDWVVGSLRQVSAN